MTELAGTVAAAENRTVFVKIIDGSEGASKGLGKKGTAYVVVPKDSSPELKNDAFTWACEIMFESRTTIKAIRMVEPTLSNPTTECTIYIVAQDDIPGVVVTATIRKAITRSLLYTDG